MNLAEALDIVVARTGHERYRALCAEGHPARDRYVPIVLAKAGEPAPDRSALRAEAEAKVEAHLARKLLVLACDYRGPQTRECGCQDRRRCWLKGVDVAGSDCLACVSG